MVINPLKLITVKNNRINNKLLLGLGMLLLAVAACKKTGLQTDAGIDDRLFRPTIDGGLVSEGNYITASWQKVKDAVSYTVQLSRDTFKTIDVSVTIDSAHITFLNLYWEKLYQVQIRSNAADVAKSSKMGSLGAIKTPKFPTILNTPGISDLTDVAVRVSWATSGAAVSMVKILKASDSSVVTSVTLTPTDIANAYTIIGGLASSTNYIIYLYSGTSVRGWANFTTKAPLSGTIIDLRGITGRPTVLVDTLAVIASGSTVLLKRGEQYTVVGAVALSKSVTIMSGDDLGTQAQAQIYVTNTGSSTSHFTFAAGSVVDYVDFKDVALSSSAVGTFYVFNVNVSAAIGRISLDGCKAEIFRGVLRLQTGNTLTVSNYVINNCIVDSIKDYAVLTCGGATAKADNVTFTNSTFYKMEKFIASSSVATNVTIQNCTINEAPSGGGTTYLIDYNTNNVTSGISMKNCIFGMTKQGGTTMTAKGVRYNTNGTADGSGSYTTSDYSALSNPISGVTAYTKLSTDLWTSPISGNFKIKDATFGGKGVAGDPRWW